MASINYLKAASICDPTKYVSLGTTNVPNPNIYESLVWAGASISKADLESSFISDARITKVNQLTINMTTAATVGITTDILVPGTPKVYKSDLQGQLLVVAAMLQSLPTAEFPSGTSVILPCRHPSTGAIEFNVHTHAQIKTVLNAITAFYESQVTLLQTKITQVYSANDVDPCVTLDLIAAIVW